MEVVRINDSQRVVTARTQIASSQLSSLAPRSSEIHVLAVDDSIIDRKVVERLLKTSSFKVTSVDSALRALEILGIEQGHSSSDDNVNRTKIDMIITDYCMPDMIGFELLRKVKASPVLKEIPVVIMSSENVPTRIERCLEEGAKEFIIKPVQLEDVKRLAKHIMVKTKKVRGMTCCKRKLELDLQSRKTPPKTRRRIRELNIIVRDI